MHKDDWAEAFLAKLTAVVEQHNETIGEQTDRLEKEHFKNKEWVCDEPYDIYDVYVPPESKL